MPYRLEARLETVHESGGAACSIKTARGAPIYEESERSWGKGEAFVAGDDPDADDAGLLALFFLGGVFGVRHGVEGAEGHGDFHGVRADGGTCAEDFVALDWAKVAFVAPVGDEI